MDDRDERLDENRMPRSLIRITEHPHMEKS